MDVRLQIKYIIIDSALVQAEIARRAGMSPQALNNSLSLRRKLSADELLKICKVIRMTPDEVSNYHSKQH